MIPYNPSSFNSNKTILEQILELKRWLIEHPQYEVYYCNDTALLSPVINSFSLADVPDNTNMDVGDLVVCNNAVYCTIISIDRDNGVFTAGYGISFKGDTGANGNDGKSIRVSSENYVNDSTAYSRANIQPVHSINEHDIVLFANDYIGYVSTISGINFYVTSTQNIKGDAGANGVSITGVTIDASGHLIVTLSDGNTIDAGSVLSGTGAYVIQLTSYTGTLSADDLAIVNDPSKTCIIDYYVNSEHSFYFKDRQITGGWRFSNLDYVEGSQITIMWYIEIDGTTGSYLQDYSEVFIRAENINSYGATSGQVLMADGSNGASWNSIPAPEGTAVKSTGETSGQVLTADGNGGASWQNAGGGTTLTKYTYTLTMNNAGIKRLHNILEGAKGRAEIIGRFFDGTNNDYFVGRYITTGTYWYLVIINAFPVYRNYLVNGISTSLSDSSSSITLYVRSTADLTTELTITSANISEITVTYWNDVEITA